MNTQEILTLATEKANNEIAKGSKLSFDKLVAMWVKQITRQQPKAMTSKDFAKSASRQESTKEFTGITFNGVRYGSMIDYRLACNKQLMKNI